MVKVSEVYKGGGSQCKPDEPELYQTNLKIADVELKEIKEDKKLIMSFEDIEELLPLNVTNAKICKTDSEMKQKTERPNHTITTLKGTSREEWLMLYR